MAKSDQKPKTKNGMNEILLWQNGTNPRILKLHNASDFCTSGLHTYMLTHINSSRGNQKQILKIS